MRQQLTVAQLRPYTVMLNVKYAYIQACVHLIYVTGTDIAQYIIGLIERR